MALTIRLNDDEIFELNLIKTKLNEKSASKAIKSMIMAWLNLRAVNDGQAMHIMELQAELDTIKANLKREKELKEEMKELHEKIYGIF
jgi:hypothetical protein